MSSKAEKTTPGSRKLPRTFYRHEDVVEVSHRLIGKVLCTRRGGTLTSGIITETEAYCGRNDRACHANNGLRTPRTEVMYREPGHAYVYLCYGIHHLFNVVTNREDLADAVLIRAIHPLEGLNQMISRRARKKRADLANGPGKLTQALEITTSDSGVDLLGDQIWIEDRGLDPSPETIISSPRIGIDYAGDDAKRPWRFSLSSLSNLLYN